MRNAWFSGNVVLPRPYVPHIGYPIIGDWLVGNESSGGFECHHIALGADSSLVIWSDLFSLPGFVNYGNGYAPPASTREWYGSLDMDPEMKYIGSNLLFFTGTDMGGNVVLGRVSSDGTTFAGSWAHFGNGLSNGQFNPFAWRRSTPDCGLP